MKTISLITVRLSLVAVLLLSLYGQFILIPNADPSAHPGSEGGSYWLYAYMAAAVLGLFCVQVILFSSWMLLNLIQRDTILTDKAFRWVDAVIWATGTAVVLAGGVALHMVITGRVRGPIGVFDEFDVTVLCIGVGIAFGLLIIILRGLLRKAVELKSEIAEVI
ncbi:DUF2975 domain-containing protein [Glycomyces harbinensis]|uniref:DUF2975 domain-containing protein n=1 Tax=Glycomyces harbinensis TaxID=58114 RepID=A0A1G7BKT7_9ACTN|nr:DUF2975 domain-containing protein [Glycomyces harbinensis]SDE27532.1 Protein of unknown function [Glycomyces harbinensis]